MIVGAQCRPDLCYELSADTFYSCLDHFRSWLCHNDEYELYHDRSDTFTIALIIFDHDCVTKMNMSSAMIDLTRLLFPWLFPIMVVPQ